MRDEPKSDLRSVTDADPPEAGRRRTRRLLAVGAILFLAAGGAGFAAWRFGFGASEPPPRPPTIAEQLAALEQAALACGAGETPEFVPPPSIMADRGLRARFALAQAGVLLRDGRAEAALERLETESNADPSIVDGAWHSLRLRALRALDRPADAERECLAWRESLGEEHPDRAWSEAEAALHLALQGRDDEAEAIASPWLGRSLSPTALSRLRLAESLFRSARGDHAVAAAAFEGARAADEDCEPIARLPCPEFVSIAVELADAAGAAGEAATASELCRHGLSLVPEGAARSELLRRHAAASRTDAAARLESLRRAAGAGGADAAEIERTNQRFLAAAESASELARRLGSDSAGDAPALRASAIHLAAECWELAGRVDEAVAAWREWLRWRPDSDPDRAEVLWRIAELLHGLQRCGEAVDAYRMLMRIHPNSPHAARAPVAAARALRAMGDIVAASDLLDGVLSGRGGIDPESPAYSAALLERGRLAHGVGDGEQACLRLEELLRREPFRDDATTVRLLLADAWRLRALEAEALAEGPSSPSERAAALARSAEAWRRAANNFAEVVARLDARDLPSDDAARREQDRFARVGLAASLEASGRVDEAITAWEEVDRRHPDSDAALVALERLRRLPGVDAEAIRRRAQRRLEGLHDDGVPHLLSREGWRLWFESPDERLAVAEGGA